MANRWFKFRYMGDTYRGVLRGNRCQLQYTRAKSALLSWENVYNTIRPHQALGYLTPQEFVEHYQQNQRKENVSLII
ncbi:MAG: integrase core domain-containing protein [Dehalococcoidia bacterium]|nr:integrase core domain-containing protein [Dehalococcoidia bacterium]